MSSKRVNQSVSKSIHCIVDTAPVSYKTEVQINIPFAVDEIRVNQVVVTVGGVIARNEAGLSIVVVSQDLLQSLNNELALAQVITKSFTTADIAYSAQTNSVNNRFVFPPSHKRNINGTFNFSVLPYNGDPAVFANHSAFSVWLFIEFIQYEPEMKIPVEPDLQQIAKSGRRRL